MNHNLAERYMRLCRAYIKLADKFQKLDVEYMTLRGKVVPLLKALKTYQFAVDQLKQEKADLEEKLQAITLKYEELKPLEDLLHPDMQSTLSEAEGQIELVDTTLNEMEYELDPDLTDADKQLLRQYQSHPEEFEQILEPVPC